MVFYFIAPNERLIRSVWHDENEHIISIEQSRRFQQFKIKVALRARRNLTTGKGRALLERGKFLQESSGKIVHNIRQQAVVVDLNQVVKVEIGKRIFRGLLF